MAIDLKLMLLADYKKPEDIIGENGLLKQPTKALLERAMQAETTHHLGWRNTIGSTTTLQSSQGSINVASSRYTGSGDPGRTVK